MSMADKCVPPLVDEAMEGLDNRMRTLLTDVLESAHEAGWDDGIDARNALMSEILVLKRDKARIDWLDAHFHYTGFSTSGLLVLHLHDGSIEKPPEFRSVIDQAIVDEAQACLAAIKQEKDDGASKRPPETKGRDSTDS